jgi:hypothetical protein
VANSIFATSDQFFEHVITPLPVVGGGREKLFREFSDHGYLARQEFVGITVMPSLAGGNVWGLVNEGNPEQPNQVKVVLLSHPAHSDEDFDNWVDVLRNWVASFDLDTRLAVSRKIRQEKAPDRGLPGTTLHKDVPPEFLVSFGRPSDFVMVFDDPSARKRKIYPTKGIG